MTDTADMLNRIFDTNIFRSDSLGNIAIQNGMAAQQQLQQRTPEYSLQMQQQYQQYQQARPRPKRVQVSKACSNCKRLHAKCDENRPCKRCVQNGCSQNCVDVPRKRRITTWGQNGTPQQPFKDQMNMMGISDASPKDVRENAPSGAAGDSIECGDLFITELNEGTNNLFSTEPFRLQRNSSYPGGINKEALTNLSSEEIFLPEGSSPIAGDLFTSIPDGNNNNNNNNNTSPTKDATSLLFDKKMLNMVQLPKQNSKWRSMLPQNDFAISVWKGGSSPGNSVLIECNERFVELVGYPVDQLKNNFPCTKLFLKADGQDWPKRTQIQTSQGPKNVTVTIYPLVGDSPAERYFILNMLEALP